MADPTGDGAQPTPWDPGLGQVMAATGRVLYEESVTGALISDPSGASNLSRSVKLPPSAAVRRFASRFRTRIQ
ncbi:MAG TPA: hypothetical protein VMF87_12690 [Streptosporangiaceae bacterium]|nr:hypothetical protein [Streptosporangiaceae bacterium]